MANSGPEKLWLPFAPQGETQEVSINLNFTGFGSLRLPLVAEVAELTHELLFAMKTQVRGSMLMGPALSFRRLQVPLTETLGPSLGSKKVFDG